MQQEAVIKVIYQIITLALLGFTGYISGKSKYLPEDAGVILSRIVIKLTAPLLIVTTMANYDFDSKTLRDGLTIYILGILFLLLAMLFGTLTSKGLRLQGAASNMYVMLSMFGNVIFLAYPLLSSIYGEKGIIYAVFFNLSNDTLLWTLGVYLVNRHHTMEWKSNLKHLINGNTIAFSIGVLFVLTNLRTVINHSGPLAKDIYNLLFNTFNPLGKTTIYLSMLFIGLILSEVKISSFADLMKRYPLMILSLFKLLLVPVVAFLMLNLAGGVIDPFVKAIVVLQLAMPCGTIVPALAAQYDSDYKFATEGVFISTLLGMVTLPVILNMILLFG
ncbi:MAG: AEC family transporter [Clostridia bacterium]|nr:AEC family transporter [Clostridia bacterium]